MNLNEQRNYCLDLMNTSKACYLSTINSSGFPETRAMLNLRYAAVYPKLVEVFSPHRDDFLIYLTTNTKSEKMIHINQNPHVSIYYCNPDVFYGVMANGKIEIISDLLIKKRLWQEGWEVYYPKGVEDPDYTILCLKPDHIKAYSNLNVFSIKPKE